jgi:hypothetical protein
MPWFAVDALDDAFDATKALLTPIDARQWLALALVVFFLGNGTASGPSATAGGSTASPSDGAMGTPGADLDVPFTFAEALPVVVVAVALALVVGLLYALVGSVMEFVFVESVRRQRVRIRRYGDQHLEQGLGLFGFRLVLGLAVALPALGVVLTAVSFDGGEPRLSVGLLLVAVPLLLVLGIVVALVDGFTTDFVVPVMVLRTVGVIAGWRRFWPALARQWDQFGVYVLVRFVLFAAVGVLGAVVGTVVGAVLFAPLVVAGAVAVPTLGGPEAVVSNPTALAVGVLLLLTYLLVLMTALAVAFVPVRTYLRYHALLVLGDADPDLDLIPNLRRRIRSGE